MNTIENESSLVDLIKESIDGTDKENVKIFGGHMPLMYQDDGPGKRDAYLDLNRWGEFSTYTFELSCQMVSYALNKGKNVELLVVVDDMVEIPKVGDKKKGFKDWMKRTQDRFYKSHDLPEEYQEIASKYGVLDYVAKQKRSFGESKLIGEHKLKSEAISQGKKAPNECSLAYNALLDDPNLFNKEEDHLVAFIPGQCKGNICSGVLEVRNDLDSMHIFFPHIETMGGIIDWRDGKGFQKIGDALTAEKMYESGQISYHKSKN